MHKCNITQNLFFIVGCGRSGTTLLKTLLDSHRELVVTPETFFYNSVAQNGTHNIQEKVEYALQKWWIKDFCIERESVYDNLSQIHCQNGWDSLFLAILQAYAQKHHANWVGEKTPSHISKGRYFINTFEGSKVICIVRDPRAVFNSYKKSKIGTISVATVITEWRRAYYEHLSLYGETNYIYIRYEDLVSQPENTLHTITKFLGVKYDSSLLEFHRRDMSGFSPEQAHHENTFRPIFKDSLDEWRTHLNRYQVSLIENRLSHEMAELGYVVTGEQANGLRTYEFLSKVTDMVHKVMIRKPRQLLKAYKARARQLNS